MSSCSRCLDDSAHPLGFQLSKVQNICTGCITHEEKYDNEWVGREQSFKQKLEEKLKSNSNKGKYDCVIPLNGDAEDYFVVQRVLSLELNPLLVFVNNYFGTEISWHNVHNLITYFDLDSVTFNPDFVAYQEMIRTSLRKFDSIYWPYQALKTSYPVNVALDFEIPLIIWGGLQATEQVGKFSHNDVVEMSAWSRFEHDLSSVNEKAFSGTGLQLSRSKYFKYKYPHLERAKRVTGLYLSNYFPWDPWSQNHQALERGFIPESNPFTFDNYERSGSSVYYQLHDLLRHKHYGYFKVRDQLSREIRHKRITRGNATEVNNLYSNRTFVIEPFFKWLGVTKSGYDWYLNHRIPEYKDLLADSGNNTPKVHDLSKSFISDFFTQGKDIDHTFLTYYKGI